MRGRGFGRAPPGKKLEGAPPRKVPWPQIIQALSDLYHQGDWRVPYLQLHARDPFQVLIGTILSQRTRDETTEEAAARLFAKYPDAPAMASAPLEDLRGLIKPVGFYPTKAQAIRKVAREIVRRFGGKTPRSFEDLLSLPMVGRKTANCVLVFGYREAAIPVDTHVHRLANRLGAVRTRTPEETEEALRAQVPPELWIPLNPLLVQHGQNLCRPQRPRCDLCPLRSWCEWGRSIEHPTKSGPRTRPLLSTWGDASGVPPDNGRRGRGRKGMLLTPSGVGTPPRLRGHRR
jgi:endonuclease-3